MTQIHLALYKGDSIELDEIEFLHPSQKESILSVRGKTTLGRHAEASFQWTSAIQALTVLMLKYAAGHTRFTLVGGTGSPAASVDFAISRQPRWVTEVFGVDKQGVSLLRRIVTRSNSNMKRPGPVAISLSNSPLNEVKITVSINGKDALETREIDEIAESLAHTLWGSLPTTQERPRRLLAA